MKKLSAVVLLASLALTTAAQAEPLKLTGAQLSSLSAGLAALDGHQRIVKDGVGERIVPEAYDMTPGTREAIAEDSIAVATILDGQRAEFKALLKLLGDKWRVEGTPEAAQAADHLDAANAKQFDVDLTKLDVAELALAKNALPPSVLRQLAPILNDLGAKPKAK